LCDERELRTRMADLEACLAALSANGPPDPDDPATNEAIREPMEQLGAVPGVVTTLDARDQAALVRLLRESLASVPLVRATGATVVADLHYGQHDVLPPPNSQRCATSCSRWLTTRTS